MTGLVDNQRFSKGLPDVFTHPCCGQMRDNSMQKAQEKNLVHDVKTEEKRVITYFGLK